MRKVHLMRHHDHRATFVRKVCHYLEHFANQRWVECARRLVKEEDLKNTTYVFTLEDGSEVSLRGDEEIEYDGELHTAANLYDALKEGYYGKF